MTPNHCWHTTNGGFTYGTGTAGMSKVQCCHCGEVAESHWYTESSPMPGHGSYAHETHTVSDIRLASPKCQWGSSEPSEQALEGPHGPS